MVSSISAHVGAPEQVAYCGTKGAISMLGKALGAVLGAHGIRVNVVEPGAVRTNMSAPMFDHPEIVKYYEDRIALHRVGEPVELAQAIAFLLQDSDVLSYWYFDSGELADRYNSCPDYFGEATSEDMAAVGNPEALASLLPDPARRSQFAEAIAGRMINGEWTAPGPDFEDERLEHLAGLLGIKGAAGFYDSLEAGEEVDGVGSAAVMHEVG